MGKIIELEQNSDDWLKFRKNYIGASDANIIMGLSKFMTREELLKQKTGEFKKNETNYIQDLGHKIEDKQIEYYNLMYDLDLKPVVFMHDDLPLMASLDGYDPEKNVAWEHKLVGKDDFEKVKNGQMLDHYMPQVQQQLFISSADFCMFAVTQHKANENTAHLVIKPDHKYINMLLKKLGDFYTEMTSKDPIKEDEKAPIIRDLLAQIKKCEKFIKLEKELKAKLFEIIPTDKYLIDNIKITKSLSKDKLVPDYEKYCVDNKVDMSDYMKTQKGRETKRITFPK